jgi:hypothetical protein
MANPEWGAELPLYPEYVTVSWDSIAGEWIWWTQDGSIQEPEVYWKLYRKNGFSVAQDSETHRIVSSTNEDCYLENLLLAAQSIKMGLPDAGEFLN